MIWAKVVHQRNDEALRQFQEVAPKNCVLCWWRSLLLDTLGKKKNQNGKKQTVNRAKRTSAAAKTQEVTWCVGWRQVTIALEGTVFHQWKRSKVKQQWLQAEAHTSMQADRQRRGCLTFWSCLMISSSLLRYGLYAVYTPAHIHTSWTT